MSGVQQPTLSDLRQLSSVRAQCRKIYQLGVENKLHHFTVREERLGDVAGFIAQLIAQDYPTLEIPFHSRWRHFEAGGIARQRLLDAAWKDVDPFEKIRRHIDLVVVSVLLDAGAGPQWKFTEPESGQTHNRSEGLGVASLRMFAAGQFSSLKDKPHQVDADGLSRLSVDDLKTAFQVSDSNPLLGLEGRVALLKRLAESMRKKPDFFASTTSPRPGLMVDWLISGQSGKDISLARLWEVVIDGFEDVWPREGRILLEGRNLGDAWRHSLLGDSSQTQSIVPFHKLSQWLTYSLLEPLIAGGFRLTGLADLTGLPEYRNGGLFIDFDVLQLKNPSDKDRAHEVDSELIVEWRALTVVLLDKTADLLRKNMNKTENELPLAKVLEAGTWKAGRRIAAEKRAGGTPPIQVLSDGTVF